ncbi:ABC1 family-domain-containing protein [Phycomyces blakesleeanus]|uniref:ABC1 atypical kinase-like domain-containing protein n=2 Tax=Phycomyces blakesleeanus TaxID=4837 RepID=A0A162XY65_PHYB8|nr:hypothetical protein PHYBLDRAFT_177136 [Phycomyces blakesleeanus NRRL 1555(-)]OAD77225.1 hypothetical protein PHYBLDRAFT_177136 [Phycomyces blakesleeanus NRRL 1555(-)]|eukprot:XP_018295265.1 hypothetical protein PHYBLDRAFT_177136 [Phycomyces blakesleeanus NRRL 1555(-)]
MSVSFASVVGVTATGTIGTILYQTNDQFRQAIQALERCGTAGLVGARVALDYRQTLAGSYGSPEEREAAKSACHQRSADHVLWGLQKLGGVYVKLGQHVSAMVYILPPEWTSTMAVLQDKCDPTSPQDIKNLFLADCGQSVDQIFDTFDWVPLGVASLAQVHRAKLRDSGSNSSGLGEWVAVKIQHPSLDNFCRIDMDTVSFIFDIVKTVFPEFGFEWFAEEMRESLPKELDFVHEAANAHKVEANFSDDRINRRTALTIPKILWAKRRIMCMEFIDGARIDDLAYMEHHNIDPREVSLEMTRVFSKMIFLDGYVHCDPHPGNVMVRPAKNPKRSKYNFDLVLLDHGLYRTLTDELRTDYARLWKSIITSDEDGIKKYSMRVGGTDVYRLFASMLTGRDWDAIDSADLGSSRSEAEFKRLSEGAIEFFVDVADILGRLPRSVLLLLKTNDLLRVVDEQLNRAASDQKTTYVVMGTVCTRAVWLDTKQRLREQLAMVGFDFKVFGELVRSWLSFQTLEWGLWFYEKYAVWAERISKLKAARLTL